MATKMTGTRKRVFELTKDNPELTNEEIRDIILKETGREYSIDTIRCYRKVPMDVASDNLYMAHCREEYASKKKDFDTDEDFLASMEYKGLES